MRSVADGNGHPRIGSVERRIAMFKKVWFVAMVVAVVSLLGAASVFADGDDSQGCMFYNEDEDVWVAGFCDGRLNAFDIAQPVAIYYSYDTVAAIR
jgi:hypothetical protein